MTHVDLFSGIGGFALAAKANGIRTVQFCEIDSRCRDFLSKAWPGVAIHDDIRTFHWGVADGTRLHQNGIRAERAPFLLTAGVPCQPASRAGKQRGEADDRWLWPESLRVLRTVAPTWCLFENPPGIGDVGLDGILSDVEAQGYEVEVLSIPACAVNAPHRRERYWIVGRHVANTACNRPGGTGKHEMSKFYRRDQIRISTTRTSQGDLADTGRLESGQDEQKRGSQGRTANRRDSAECVGYAESGIERAGENKGEYKWHDRSELSNAGSWNHFVWLPCADGKVRRSIGDTQRMAYGLPVELLEELGAEGRQTPEDCEVHRSILGALGNSIVWPVAEMIISAMIESESDFGLTAEYVDMAHRRIQGDMPLFNAACGHHIGDANEMVREG